ncbi:homeodomain-like protein [Tanacetum coccineum]
MATPFANPERQFRARRDTSPAPIHNIYSFYESESSESESEDVGEIYIETLTLEQYFALNLNNTRRRISNPEDATFKIKGQFLRELRKTTFLGSSTENAIEHIGKVLEISSLFNTNDSALLRVFPLTLVGIAKRWFDRTSPEHAKNWDEVKQIFIRRFCPPSIILKQLGEIHNFKHEDGESIFHTWERYNDLLFKCPFHDLNDHQKLRRH